MNWSITWGKHTFTSDDLTVQDIAAAQMLTNDGWRSADPLTGPNHAANLIGAVVSRLERRPLTDVIAEVAVSPALVLIDAIKVLDAGESP